MYKITIKTEKKTLNKSKKLFLLHKTDRKTQNKTENKIKPKM